METEVQSAWLPAQTGWGRINHALSLAWSDTYEFMFPFLELYLISGKLLFSIEMLQYSFDISTISQVAYQGLSGFLFLSLFYVEELGTLWKSPESAEGNYTGQYSDEQHEGPGVWLAEYCW